MIMNCKKVFLTACLLIGILKVEAQTLRIATFNIRYYNDKDSSNLWIDRAPRVAGLIRFHDFDVFGVQEAYKNQLEDMSNALPEYARYGVGRDDGKEAGEHSSIYYKKDLYKLVKSGDFWLSETPNKPGKGWDAKCCNRICSWVFLEDIKSLKKFYVFNVHFDHQGVIARIESAKLILQKIAEITANQPVILTGDFNGNRASESYQILSNSTILTDSYAGVKFPYENNASFNGFKTPRGMDVIDHIFITKHFTSTKWGILTDTYFGKYPSDHFPVVSHLNFNK